MAKAKKDSGAQAPKHEAVTVKSAVVTLPAPSAVPLVPEGYKPLSGPARQGLLKIAADQTAETDQALDQLYAKRAQLKQDLGTLAPDADQGQVLSTRMLEARELNQLAQAFAAFTADQEALANDAVVTYISTVTADIEHMTTKNPQIAARYDRVLKVGQQRSQAIIDGIAAAKARKTPSEETTDAKVAPKK